ncbi:MAG: lytic transglycosylase domain-containing protein [Bacillota bacterium]|nr:lytic transglycosylase domain-containing protein [Bacillota bacterium]
MRRRLLLPALALLALVWWGRGLWEPVVPAEVSRAALQSRVWLEVNSGLFDQVRRIHLYVRQVNPALTSEEALEITYQIILSARKYDLDPFLAASLAGVESRFERRAVSHRGALGIMQLMPETARALGVEDPFDPLQNIDAGVRYLAQLLKKYDGDVSLAIAAYNAGPARVEERVPPYRETEQHVERVTTAYVRLTAGRRGRDG